MMKGGVFLIKNFEELEINSSEIQEFYQYVELKGINLYKQLYDVVIQFKGTCSYAEIAAIIRYDKGIRNVLYKFLSAFEEKMRADLFKAFDTTDTITNPEVARIEKLKLIENSKSVSNLYKVSFSRHFTLTVLRKVLFEKRLIDDEINEDFKEIVNLRNKTMHHNILMTSYHVNSYDVNKEIIKIQKWIEILYKYLPEGMNHEFEKAINRCNNIGTKINVPNLEIICLREMRNGVFI